MDKEEHFRKLSNLYSKANSQKPYTTGIKISEGRAEQTLPVRDEYLHAAHAVHGHIYFKVMDDTSFFAANSLVQDVFVLTVSFNVYFVRPIDHGEMRASAEVVFRSRNLIIADARIENELGKEIGRGSGTFMRSKIPLTPDIGYA